MAIIRMTGWRVGLRKVSMTQALQQYAGLSLTNAKHITDRVLDGFTIDISMDIDKAILLRQVLDQLGAEVIVSDSIMSFTPFEKTVLDAYIIAASDSEILRNQIASANVVSREFSGVGVFTYFTVDRSCAILQTTERTIALKRWIHIRHPAIPDGASPILFVKDGYIEMLECVAYDNVEWPEDESLFLISFIDRKNQ